MSHSVSPATTRTAVTAGDTTGAFAATTGPTAMRSGSRNPASTCGPTGPWPVATTGEPVWTSNCGPSFLYASPAVANGVVYQTSGDQRLCAFDAATGEKLYNHRVSGDANYGSPAVADGVVYFGSWDHHVYAMSAAPY